MYAIITENDQSEWADKTGELYHFPNKFKKILTPDTKVVYYKGSMKDKSYKNLRLESKPHYFGVGVIEDVFLDENSDKRDWFATIKNFVRFDYPILAKFENEYLETINPARPNSFWRDGVRKTTEEVYNRIIRLSGLNLTEDDSSLYNDQEETFLDTEIEMQEGKQTRRYSTVYERNPRLRTQALRIHGYTCMACGMNFEEVYGEIGKGFIHVHHIKPVSVEERSVNPRTDMVVLCPNCHCMIHRKKGMLLSIEELKSIINQHLLNNPN